ncbi:MAG: hypothetical protein KJ067_14580 [Vicinamibacteria bacterium]|nr:hypothetical protein [Vicinamibacteria bacterium]
MVETAADLEVVDLEAVLLAATRRELVPARRAERRCACHCGPLREDDDGTLYCLSTGHALAGWVVVDAATGAVLTSAGVNAPLGPELPTEAQRAAHRRLLLGGRRKAGRGR